MCYDHHADNRHEIIIIEPNNKQINKKKNYGIQS